MGIGKIFVTIDTERDADTKWQKEGPARFTSVTQGIPHLLRPIWDTYDIHPIYFVSPEVAENQDCALVLKAEAQKGAIIGAHLHPEYIEPEKGFGIQGFPCYSCDTKTEKQKIQNLRNLIEKNIGVTPVWYRAARFGADIDTIKILSELGFLYDSSFTPQIDWSKKGGPDHSNVPLKKYAIWETGFENSITEYPVTICGKRFGLLGYFLPQSWLFFRWLRPTHMTYLEERSFLKELKHRGIQDVVMMFHSMEIMPGKTPYVRTVLGRKYFLWRLCHTLAFAKKIGYESYQG